MDLIEKTNSFSSTVASLTVWQTGVINYLAVHNSATKSPAVPLALAFTYFPSFRPCFSYESSPSHLRSLPSHTVVSIQPRFARTVLQTEERGVAHKIQLIRNHKGYRYADSVMFSLMQRPTIVLVAQDWILSQAAAWHLITTYNASLFAEFNFRKAGQQYIAFLARTQKHVSRKLIEAIFYDLFVRLVSAYRTFAFHYLRYVARFFDQDKNNFSRK